MNAPRRVLALAACGGLGLGATDVSAQAVDDVSTRTVADVMDDIQDDEWRTLDPENALYLRLPGGTVVMELATGFAPRHVANIKALARGGWFDGGAVHRSQDNYVAQWAPRPLPEGEAFPNEIASSLPPEFETSTLGMSIAPLPDGDVYAPEVGFTDGFPVGRDPEAGTTWIAHCYGVVGVARGTEPGSGSGASLYAVTGHAPRHLDRNLTMVGRVVSGMEHLSTLPRGTGALGFYETPEEWTPLESVRLGIDLPADQRAPIEILDTDSRSFRDLILASRSRAEAFFVRPSERIELCNVRIPTRSTTPS